MPQTTLLCPTCSSELHAEPPPMADGRPATPDTLPMSPEQIQAALAPDFRFANWGRYSDAHQGIVMIGGDTERLAERAAAVRVELAQKPMDFLWPAPKPSLLVPVIGAAAIHKLWEGFYVGAVLDTAYAKPGGVFHVCVLALNASAVPQQHALVPVGFAPPPQMQSALNFNLQAQSWEVRPIPIAAPAKPGAYSIGFRDVSGGQRAATAALTGVATLGTVVYAPGFKGFKLGYTVATADQTQWLNQIEAEAKRLSAARLGGSSGVVTTRGRLVSSGDVARLFGAYLTPGRIIGSAKNTTAATLPEKLWKEFLARDIGAAAVAP